MDRCRFFDEKFVRWDGQKNLEIVLIGVGFRSLLARYVTGLARYVWGQLGQLGRSVKQLLSVGDLSNPHELKWEQS